MLHAFCTVLRARRQPALGFSRPNPRRQDPLSELNPIHSDSPVGLNLAQLGQDFARTPAV
jgi:hypothetical protein